jgi:AbrB family looped-hinge helix DNA binding protein
MRITSKGQVTIPIEIRQQLGLLPDTEVIFELDGDAVRIRPAPRSEQSRGRRLVQRMRGKATVQMSTEQILALTRGADDEPSPRRQQRPARRSDR